MQTRIGLVTFTVAVVAIGVGIGLLFTPGAWYAQLDKPWFNPPNWLFGPVWTALYVAIGIAGWRVWPLRRLRTLWLVQMLLNYSWSPVFFGAHQIATALAIIGALLATILVFVRTAWPLERVAASLFIPYAAWVAFATLLNAALWKLN